MAVTFLVASLGLGLFAAVYRSTLDDGLEAQAAYAVPLDFRVQEDFSQAGLVAPLEAAPLADYEALGADAVVPVIRQTGTVAGAGQATLLGVPAETAAEVSSADLESADVELAGPDLPEDAARLELPVSTRRRQRGDHRDRPRRPAAGFARIPLGRHAGRRTRPCSRARSRRRPGAGASSRSRSRGPTRSPGTATSSGPTARSRSAISRADGEPILTGYADWVGLDGVEADGNEVTFLLSNEAANPRFQPRQPTDGEPVPVVVTPGLAARAGEGDVLAVRVPSGQISVRVAGVVDRFPTVSGDVILGDERELFVALNSASPGTTVPDELWLDGPESVGAALAEPPFDVLDVSSRAEVQHRLESDPLARGSLATLTGAALAAALLAFFGLALLLAGDVRDEGRELFDLEAQGAGPRTLRRHLRLRAGLVAGLGLLGGLAAAALLSILAVDLVTLTANAAAPEPPLSLSRELARRRRRVPRLRVRRRRAHRRVHEEGRVSAIEAKDLFCVFSTPEGDAAALQGLTLDGRGARGAGRARAERLGEVDAPAHPRRARAAVGRDRAGVRRRSHAAGRTPARRLPRLDARLRRAALLPLARSRPHRAGARRRAARPLRRDPQGARAPRRRAARAGRPRRQARRLSARALGRRAAADRGLRRARAPARSSSSRTSRPASSTPPTRGSSRVCIGELAREHGCTTVVVTHDVETTAIADRIVRVRDGRVSEESRGNGDGDEALVVGKGGWVRLPEELVVRAGLGDRARAALGETGIVLSPTGEARPAGQAEPAAVAAAQGDNRAVAEVRGLREGLRERRARVGRPRRARRDVRGGTARRGHGPVRLGEDDAPAPPRGPRRSDGGRGDRARHARSASSTARPARRCGASTSP